MKICRKERQRLRYRGNKRLKIGEINTYWERGTKGGRERERERKRERRESVCLSQLVYSRMWGARGKPGCKAIFWRRTVWQRWGLLQDKGVPPRNSVSPVSYSLKFFLRLTETRELSEISIDSIFFIKLQGV